MPDSFENRFREATVVPVEGELAAMREATKSAASELGSGAALDLVRVAHGRPVSAEAEERLRRRFNSEKEMLVERGQAQLLATLGAITLISVFGRPKYKPGLVPALAVRAAVAQGWRAVHPDVLSHARAYVESRAAIERSPVPNDDFGLGEGEGAEADPLVEIKGLREALLRDRSLREEDNRVVWWLLSRVRPRSNRDAALEYAALLHRIPEPAVTTELLRSKFAMVAPVSESIWAFEAPEVPSPLADFCTRLPAAVDAPGELQIKRTYTILNEILLIRALEERPVEQ